MTGCLKEELLQAFADNEVGSKEKAIFSDHVTSCGVCRGKLERIQSSSKKLEGLLGTLVPEGLPTAGSGSIIELPQQQSGPFMGWAGIASISAIAALMLVGLLLIRRGPGAPNLPAVAHVTAPRADLSTAAKSPAAVKKSLIRNHAHKQLATILKFHALDNGGPIESGLIYQINLPVSNSGDSGHSQSAKTVPAEVIVDETGQVRAIRFLH